MPSWTCPNPKCVYDKQLGREQHCPLCGEEAKGFNFSEFGNILKEKWSLKKSIGKLKEHEEIMGRMKFCPKCGSTNINFLIFYRPSMWKCLNCSYQGALVVENGKLGEKIRRRYKKKQKRTD